MVDKSSSRRKIQGTSNLEQVVTFQLINKNFLKLEQITYIREYL